MSRRNRLPDPLAGPAFAPDRQIVLHDDGRTMGVLMIAPRGAGKSRYLGRIQAWLDFLRCVATILWDPTGGMIANFLDKVMREPAKVQKRLWPRVRIVDFAGRDGLVMPRPLLMRSGTEQLYEVSQRFPDLIRRIDPALTRAPVLGWNAFYPLATAAGTVLAALGFQLTEATNLVTQPELWRPLFDDPRLAGAETQAAVHYLTHHFLALPERERIQRAETLITKLSLLTWDPVSRAMYGASHAGIEWDEVASERLIVLFDFSGLRDVNRLQFAMLWTFRSFVDWLRRRGAGYHHQPISLVIDELTAMIGGTGTDHDLLAADFEEVIARLARSHKLWLSVAFQELAQMPERIAAVLLTLGNQIFGATSDVETALKLAQRYERYDPGWVKKVEPVYSSYMGVSNVIDERSVEFTLNEQAALSSVRFLDLPRYEFLIGTAPHEGRLPTNLRRMSIAGYDAGMFPDEDLVARAKKILAERDGQRIDNVLQQIDARLGPVLRGEVAGAAPPVSSSRSTRRRVELHTSK